jgi:hypothetical protein
LCDRAPTGIDGAVRDGGADRARDRNRIDGAVVEEALVLDGDNGPRDAFVRPNEHGP